MKSSPEKNGVSSDDLRPAVMKPDFILVIKSNDRETRKVKNKCNEPF